MKILLLDDSRKRRVQIKEAVSQNQHKLLDCSTSNDFVSSLENDSPELVLLDMETWRKGKSIYNYFRISKKLENIPIIFYNAEEDSYFIPERNRHEKDRVLSKPTEVENIVETMQQF